MKFHFTQLRKLETEEGSLRRSDFISDLNKRDIAHNADVKERIKREAKRMNDAQLKEYPYPQQIAGCELADRYDRFAFFYDMGTGKTAMALNVISNKYQKYGAKFLIIAPIAVIKSALKDKFGPLKNSEDTTNLGIVLAQVKKAKEIQASHDDRY